MTTYIGNFANLINIDDLLQEVKSSNGDRRIFEDSYFDVTKPGFSDIMNNWRQADYKMNHIEWFNYYNGVQFSNSYTEKFAAAVNATPVKVWISEIHPGKCFPYHWDVDLDTSNYEEGKMVRYQMMMHDYILGHFFVLEDKTFTGYKKGDVYMWNDYREWHAGGNISFTKKYMYNFLGKAK